MFRPEISLANVELLQRLQLEKCAIYETTYSATFRDNHESTRCPATYTSVKRLIERLFNFAFRSERKATKHFFLQRLEDAIKLHRDDQGQAVINPASLALFATSSLVKKLSTNLFFCCH